MNEGIAQKIVAALQYAYGVAMARDRVVLVLLNEGIVL